MSFFIAEIVNNLHNILVHFPISIVIINVFMLLLSYYRSEYRYTLRFLLLLNVVFTSLAFLAGEFKEEAIRFESEFLEIHEELGKISLIVVIVTSLTGFGEVFLPRLKVFTNLLIGVTAIVVSVTGYYGGMVAHPHGGRGEGPLRLGENLEGTYFEEYRVDTFPDTLYPLMEEEPYEE